MRISIAAVLVLVVAGLGGAVPATSEPGAPSNVRTADRPTDRPTDRPAAPALRVTRQVSGMVIPWDVKPIGFGRLLITERNSGHLILWQNGHKRQITFPSRSVWVSGETGLMGLEIDPDFATNGRFYTCQGGFTGGGGHEIHVMAWRLDAAATKATFQKELVGDFPTSSGRHGGCRLLILRGGALLVGTGDAAQGTNPQNQRSLGGKTLRLNRMTGAPSPFNPWPNADNLKRRYVYTYGHRNVQGLAQRADGTFWSVEHGPDRDDEVNRLFKGGNYGWHPVPGYNESVPMTDFSLPGVQIGARWRSGRTTFATSGATWVRGAQWGTLNGTLAVAALKDSKMRFMKFDAAGHLVSVHIPGSLTRFGRLRSVTVALDGDLLVTTSNGRNDSVLRVHPLP
jgi:glucose/arabinose dehydrogenase